MITDEQREALGLLDERKDFYFKVENAVIDSEDVFDNVYESMLYIVLTRHWNAGNYILPSFGELSESCYCTEEHINFAMEKLVEKNLLVRIKHENLILFKLKRIGDK
ncbi:MAG: hypothetical protein ACRC6J_04465 [Cetobacterium sp.]